MASPRIALDAQIHRTNLRMECLDPPMKMSEIPPVPSISTSYTRISTAELMSDDLILSCSGKLVDQ